MPQNCSKLLIRLILSPCVTQRPARMTAWIVFCNAFESSTITSQKTSVLTLWLGRSSHDGAGRVHLNTVAASLVALHVAAYAESFSTASLRALERLLASVGVAVNAQAAGATEGLVARRADVAVLRLRVEMPRGGVKVVVVRPADGSGRRGNVDRHVDRRERLGQRLLMLHAVRALSLGRLRRCWSPCGWEVAAVGVLLL